MRRRIASFTVTAAALVAAGLLVAGWAAQPSEAGGSQQHTAMKKSDVVS